MLRISALYIMFTVEGQQSENNFCRKHPQCRYFFYANDSAAEKLVPLHEDLSASGFGKKLFSDKLLLTTYYYTSYSRQSIKLPYHSAHYHNYKSYCN